MSKNIVKDKSFKFALSVIELYKMLKVEGEFIISKQLLRSGTSIGANIEEGLHGQSKPDFISKLSISLKEACETLYWLELLKVSELTKIDLSSYINDCNEIISILTKILKLLKMAILLFLKKIILNSKFLILNLVNKKENVYVNERC